MRIKTIVLILLAVAAVWSQGRGKFAGGYDEGLAGRFFFTEKMGLQLSVGAENLGQYDDVTHVVNTNTDVVVHVPSEANYSVAVGFLYSLINKDAFFLDALGQVAYAHDGSRSTYNLGDINYVLIRAALSPEILIASHLGLGLRAGVEMALVSNEVTAVNAAGQVTHENSSRTNIRLFGPQNPFYGSTLGFAVYFYPGL